MKKSLVILSALLFAATVPASNIGASNAASIDIIPQAGSGITKKQQNGYNACVQWCAAHNKTMSSRNQCIFQCDIYWGKHQS